MPLAIADELILACSRSEPDLQRVEQIAAREPDWSEVISKAELWRVVPLINTNLRQVAPSVPVAVLDRLRHLARRDTIHAAARWQLLREALTRLAEAKLPVIVVRGAALAALVYPRSNARTLGRIDLLVREGDRRRADALLRGVDNASDSPTQAGIQRRRIRVHDRLSGSPVAAPADRLPIEAIWQRAEPAEIESVATLVLSDGDLLLQTALDLVTRLSWPNRSARHVRTLCDLGFTCRRYASAIDWGRIAVEARRHGFAKPLHYALRLARDLVGAPVPDGALAELGAHFVHLPFEERFVTGVAARAILTTAASPSAVAEIASHLMTSRGRDQGRLAYRLVARALRAGAKRVAGTRAKTGADSPGEDSPAEISVDSLKLPAARRGEVAVTYDPHRATDGVGSQLHRIYGLYAMARALGVKYVHTPLACVAYQGFVPLLTGRSDPDFAFRYGELFPLPSDDFDLASCERIRIHVLTKDLVEQHAQRAAATGRPVLLQALHHYAYTDAHPESLLAARDVSPYRNHRASGPVRVCIHVRRGDTSVRSRSDGEQRLLPNSYYLRVCGTVLEALRQQGVPFVVRLHSEVAPRRYTLYPDTPGLYFRLNEPAVVDPSDYNLDELESLPNLEMVLNVDALQAIDDFATADVLILSLSSLGYLGGLLNPHGLVVYAPWWHPALPGWLAADQEGNLDAAQVSAHIADHLRRRA